MKRIMRITALILILLVAFTLTGCKKQVVPEISNPNGAYANVGSYQVTNSEAYYRAKSSFGLQVLLDQIDRKLLASYLSQVTDDRIEEIIHNEIYGSTDIATLPEEEVEKLEAEFYEEQALQGRHSKELVKAYYALEEARKLYALEKFTEEVNNYKDEDGEDAEYFTEQQYKTYYNNNYRPEVTAIIVTFITEYEARIALETLGIKVDRTGLKWVTTNDEDLTPAQVYNAFIALYNGYNGYYRVGEGLLIDAYDYTVTDGKFAFTTDYLDKIKDNKYIKFVYKYSDYGTSHVITQKLFNDNGLKVYEPTITDETDKTQYTERLHQTYTPSPVASGTSKFHLILKVAVGETQKLEDVKDEIKTKLIENALTTSKINEKLIALRKDAKFTIHDYFLMRSYQNYDSTLKAPKKVSKTVIATIQKDGKTEEITADQLFTELSKLYGPLVVSDLLDREVLIHDSTYNDVYDLNTNKVLNKNNYRKLEDIVEQYKEELEAGSYASRGFSKDYGWKNFMRDAYGFTDEKQLLLKVALYDYVVDKFIEKSYTFADVQKEMQRMVDEFFEASIISINVFVDYNNDNLADRQYLEPENSHLDNWNLTQITLAKNLLNLVKEKVADKKYIDPQLKEPDYTAGFNRLIADYNNARLDDLLWGDFKKAGLRLAFENLGTVSNATSHADEIKAEARKLWEIVEPSERGKALYPKVVLGENDPKYWSDVFATTNGYRYIGITKATEYTYAKKADNRILPTEEEINLYLEDANTPDLTTAVKSSIKKYYETSVNILKSFSITKTGRVNILLHQLTVSKGVTFTDSKLLEVYNQVHDIFYKNKTYNFIED